jgi:NAD(P)-dependent dehydrogenase (short-subunit alcohol dehydrogenase family)
VAYGQSKTADALLAVGFSRQYAADGVTANAVHPGAIMTGLQRHLSRQEQVARGFIDQAGRVNPRWKTPEEGAATSVWAAVAPELAGVAGHYLEDCQIASPWAGQQPFTGYLPYALDPERADRLWQVSASQITATGAL